MKFSDDNVSDILNLTLEKSYETYLIMCVQYPELEEELDSIKYGIKLLFDIRDYFNNKIKILPKTEVAIINGKYIPLRNFRDEIEARNSKMKKLMLDIVTEDDIVKGHNED